ncbi:hypothetical protein NONO_c74440 [Nocardia nova SH22a]|uniref:Uncharacterized protein n=1 Tax=Nocardia nova SH22a TaxID=1415166 RepID=W5TSM3_9NOCA|nr:hypothetical protein [Nocardia nova]AHH22199.1 hypothetical protein NONO_c74440 [Nocardia nova SH22a]
MTGLEFDPAEVSGFVVAAASTPLARAAARLQAVLPPGWRVDIDVATPRPQDDPQPVLRVRMSEN